MKKVLSIIYIGILFLVCISCQKTFLEKNPTDQISSQTFWQTETDVQMGLTGIYSEMTGVATFNHGRMLWDGLSDIGYCTIYPQIGQGIIESTSGSIISGIYSDCYDGISRCNIFLVNVDKVVMSDQSKATYKAEAYFLRAYFYFYLTEFYGGVPLYTTPPTVSDANIAKSSKDDVVTQVLADIELALASLPDQAYTGHAVKGSALALKSMILMHNQRWADAATAANQIITSRVFTLYNNYPKMFLVPGQDNNPEIIFSVRFLGPNNYTPTTSDMNPDLIGAHAHAISPIQQYVDAFECTDGLPISTSPLYNATHQFLNRDPRLLFTVSDTAIFNARGKPVGETGEGFRTGYSCEKYVNWANAPYSWATRSDQDFIIFRYAQVLLMYAECQNEAVGPDQSVYNVVNLVRARPGVNMPPLPAGLDKAGMRTRIRHERMVELGLEGFRYLDLKRWKTAETVIPTILDPGGIPRKFDPAKNYLFPFPLSETDRNPNLVQNPGY